MAAGACRRALIADWTVDVGPDAPSMDVPWEGWVDLRREWQAASVHHLAEIGSYPELAPLLLSLNSGHLFSSKIDVFPVSADEADPEIAEAGESETAFGLGSYIDVVSEQFFVSDDFCFFEGVARLLAATLSKMEEPGLAAVEVVVRPARLFGTATFGWTLYAMGFGPTPDAARCAWIEAASGMVGRLHEEVAAMMSWRRDQETLADGSD